MPYLRKGRTMYETLIAAVLLLFGVPILIHGLYLVYWSRKVTDSQVIRTGSHSSRRQIQQLRHQAGVVIIRGAVEFAVALLALAGALWLLGVTISVLVIVAAAGALLAVLFALQGMSELHPRSRR